MNDKYIYALPSGDDGKKIHPITHGNVSDDVADKIATAHAESIAADARIKNANAAIIEANLKMARAQILLNGMGELRLALNMPSVDEEQSGVGENVRLRPMFSEDHIENLQLHYMKAYQKYEEYYKEVMEDYKHGK